VIQALEAPVDAPKLTQCLKSAKRVAIVISDKTRPCPSARLLPPLLDGCRETGIRDQWVTVISALGAHGCQNDAERRGLVGDAVWDRVEVVDSNPEDVTFLGVTRAGTPVEVDRRVAEADVVIAVGNIEYHYFAGYTGGMKAIVPGCASRSTVAANHRLMTQPGAVAGEIYGNPLRMDFEEAAELVGVAFILNVVLDGAGHIAAAIAGDPIGAHRAGCRILDAHNRAHLDAPVPIVVASVGGYPKDIDLYQAQKGMDNAARALAQEGTLVLVAECREGIGDPTFARWMKEESDPAARIGRLDEGFVLGGHKAAAISRVLLKASEVALVSTLPPWDVEQMGFVPYRDAQVALDAALARHGSSARTCVIPNAATTLPILTSAEVNYLSVP
jgi:nickel-dependent lactate racemase